MEIQRFLDQKPLTESLEKIVILNETILEIFAQLQVKSMEEEPE